MVSDDLFTSLLTKRSPEVPVRFLPSSRSPIAPQDPAASAPLPPVPKRVPHVTFFGKVEGQDRGDDAMDPPRQVRFPLRFLLTSAEPQLCRSARPLPP